MALMAIMACVGAVTGGITAAQQTCKAKDQTQKVIEQTKNYIANANQTFTNLTKIDQNILNNTMNLQVAANAATNELLTLKQGYVSTIKKMQIGVAMVIIIVFMLLLGKKLKIY